jgi:integrase
MADRVSHALAHLHEQTLFPSAADLVFYHPETGNPLDRSKLVRRFAQEIDRADLPKVTFHELRHTFGTRMAAAGVPIRTIQQWMGHADMKTTQIYAHYQPTDNEAETISRAFG